ncbi:MAG: SRPBCC family protein [Thermoplasmata archaeon]|nr:SRPBCC family protein [Thermoplasmata archaeon]
MISYDDESVFPAPKDAVWKLLRSHLDDQAIGAIHPLILGQKTVSQEGDVTIVDRTIDVRGKKLASRWKITYHAPDSARWEIQSSEGPWAPGSFLEMSYSDAPGGTLVRTRGELKVSVLPFFIPQKGVIRKALETVHQDDIAALPR